MTRFRLHLHPLHLHSSQSRSHFTLPLPALVIFILLAAVTATITPASAVTHPHSSTTNQAQPTQPHSDSQRLAYTQDGAVKVDVSQFAGSDGRYVSLKRPVRAEASAAQPLLRSDHVMKDEPVFVPPSSNSSPSPSSSSSSSSSSSAPQMQEMEQTDDGDDGQDQAPTQISKSPFISKDPLKPTIWGSPTKDGVDPVDPFCKWKNGMKLCA